MTDTTPTSPSGDLLWFASNFFRENYGLTTRVMDEIWILADDFSGIYDLDPPAANDSIPRPHRKTVIYHEVGSGEFHTPP